MDELATISRRGAAVRPDLPAKGESRFRNLVQSPLRAGLLRFLSARPGESFDVDSLMSTFGRMYGDKRARKTAAARLVAPASDDPSVESG